MKYLALTVLLFFSATSAFAGCENWENDYESNPELENGLGGCSLFTWTPEFGYASDIGGHIGASILFPYHQANWPDGGLSVGPEAGVIFGKNGNTFHLGFRRSVFAMIAPVGYGIGLLSTEDRNGVWAHGVYAELQIIVNAKLSVVQSDDKLRAETSFSLRL